jgi:hypothetical protein
MVSLAMSFSVSALDQQILAFDPAAVTQSTLKRRDVLVNLCGITYAGYEYPIREAPLLPSARVSNEHLQ